MLLTEIGKIENGRIFTKDEGLFECPHCKSTFAKNFAKDKMRRWGKDKQMFYTTKHCPNCDRRILMKDQNKDVLQRKIERLRQYANQCRITGDLEEYREALKEIANLEAEFRSLIDNLTIKDAESVALNQIGNLKKSIAKDTALRSLDSLKKSMKRKTKDNEETKQYKEGYLVGVREKTRGLTQPPYFGTKEREDWINGYLKGYADSHNSKDSKTKDTWIDEYKGYKIVVKEFGSNTFEFTIQKNGEDVYKGVKETLLGARATPRRLIDQNKVSDSKARDEDKVEAYGVKGNNNSNEEAKSKIDDYIRQLGHDKKTKDINPPSESERIKKDFEAGRKDHNAGYYDKWYRWNRKDNGKAYDDGFNSVAGKPVQIIEAMHDSKKTKDAGKVEVKRQSDVGSNRWGIYVNGKLVEGGFFSKEVAEENASKNYGGAKDSKDADKFEITISLSDPDNSLVKFLKALAVHANPGHSFEVIMDPDSDNVEKFGFDGDGAFRIDDIKVNGEKLKETKDSYNYKGKDYNQNELWSQLVKEGNTKRFSELTEEEKKAKGDRFAIYESRNGSIYAVVRDSKTKDVESPVGKHNADPDDQFNAEELAMGIKIEMEHTENEEIAKGIAKDHLSEIPDYYTRLTKMEEEAKKEKES